MKRSSCVASWMRLWSLTLLLALAGCTASTPAATQADSSPSCTQETFYLSPEGWGRERPTASTKMSWANNPGVVGASGVVVVDSQVTIPWLTKPNPGFTNLTATLWVTSEAGTQALDGASYGKIIGMGFGTWKFPATFAPGDTYGGTLHKQAPFPGYDYEELELMSDYSTLAGVWDLAVISRPTQMAGDEPMESKIVFTTCT